MALAGAPCFMPALTTLDALAPRYASFLTATVVVLLNSSSAVFLLLAQIQRHTGATLQTLLWIYGATVVALGFVCFGSFLSKAELDFARLAQNKIDETFCLPSRTAKQQQHGAGIHEPLLDVGQPAMEQTATGMSQPASSLLPLWLRGHRLWGYLFTSSYLVFLALPVNAYIGTLSDQLRWKGASSHRAADLVTAFNIALPVGSALSFLFLAPLAQICDARNWDAAFQFGGFVVTAVAFLVMTFGSLDLQWVAIVLYPLTFVWPWVAVPEFLRRFYPVDQRNLLLGGTIVGVAAFGFLQYPLVAMALASSPSGSTTAPSFYHFNLIMLVFVALGGLSPAYLAVRRQYFRLPTPGPAGNTDRALIGLAE